MSPVSNVIVPPNGVDSPLIVIALFVRLLFGILANAKIPLALSYVIPVAVVALKCARTSLELGPVYVNTPLLVLYAKLPSPPLSIKEILPRALAAVKYKFAPSLTIEVVSPVMLLPLP